MPGPLGGLCGSLSVFFLEGLPVDVVPGCAVILLLFGLSWPSVLFFLARLFLQRCPGCLLSLFFGNVLVLMCCILGFLLLS